mmetsp:Transcript_96641/g.277528  ORF Transcript_96641/g.277528 Transcript_96641/m.277528 type:complete len:291 (-) Transcript_96641:24-896(-)
MGGHISTPIRLLEECGAARVLCTPRVVGVQGADALQIRSAGGPLVKPIVDGRVPICMAHHVVPQVVLVGVIGEVVESDPEFRDVDPRTEACQVLLDLLGEPLARPLTLREPERIRVVGEVALPTGPRDRLHVSSAVQAGQNAAVHRQLRKLDDAHHVVDIRPSITLVSPRLVEEFVHDCVTIGSEDGVDVPPSLRNFVHLPGDAAGPRPGRAAGRAVVEHAEDAPAAQRVDEGLVPLQRRGVARGLDVHGKAQRRETGVAQYVLHLLRLVRIVVHAGEECPVSRRALRRR